MAKKQSRRSVSLNRLAFDAAKQEADRRGVSLAALVETGLAAIGIPIPAHPQQTAEQAQANAIKRAESVARKPSRERQVLGDAVADAYGFA